jgi:hypothetical protein
LGIVLEAELTLLPQPKIADRRHCFFRANRPWINAAWKACGCAGYFDSHSLPRLLKLQAIRRCTKFEEQEKSGFRCIRTLTGCGGFLVQNQKPKIKERFRRCHELPERVNEEVWE